MATRQSDSPTRARKRAPQASHTIKRTAPPSRDEVSNEARYVMIQEAAYLRAERRGFEPGFELEDWLAAENEVDTLLGEADRAAPQ